MCCGIIGTLLFLLGRSLLPEKKIHTWCRRIHSIGKGRYGIDREEQKEPEASWPTAEDLLGYHPEPSMAVVSWLTANQKRA